MLSQYFHNKVAKTIVIQDEATSITQIIPTQIDISHEQMVLLQILTKVIPDLRMKEIKTYDFIKNSYTTINSQTCVIPNSFMLGNPSNIILIKIAAPQQSSAVNSVASQQLLQIKSQTSSVKKERSKQRVIFQVIEIVKKWREIHLSKNNFKKISLQESAKMVGLPKKSLDDYYYQLRLGQKYDFDFKAHLFDRIGILRTYLKNLKEHSQLDKNQKHPKKLKIIDNFQHLAEIFNRQKQQMLDYGMDGGMQAENVNNEGDYNPFQYQMKIENQSLNEQESRGIQNHFYNQFEYLLNQKDPFLSCDYNFKKKCLDESHSEELFF